MNSSPIQARASMHGRLVPLAELSIPVTAPSVQHGIGLFETCRVTGGTLPLFEWHARRLAASARELRWGTPPSTVTIRRWLAQLLRANRLHDGACKWLWLKTRPGAWDLILLPQPYLEWDAGIRERGAAANIADTRRQSADRMYRHKTISRAWTDLARDNAGDTMETVILNERGEICEGCTTSMFVISGNRVLTPPLDAPCLAGALRAALLDRRKRWKLPLQEAVLTLRDLRDADAVFLGNALRGVIRVTWLQKKPLDYRETAVVKAFLARVKSLLEPAS